MKKNIYLYAAVAVSAFGLSGCVADKIDSGDNNKVNGMDAIPENVVSIVVPSQVDTVAKGKTRLGAEELSDRLRFRWTSGDYKYLYCDVTPLATNATWKKSSQQYGDIDDSRKTATTTFYNNTAFVFPDLKPFVTYNSDNGSYGNDPMYNPHNGTSYGSQDLQNIIRSIWSSGYYAYTWDGSFQSSYVPGYQSAYYPVMYTNGNNGNQVNVRRDQRQGGAYPDSLGFNGACFVGVAYANYSGYMSGKPGFTQVYDKSVNQYKNTWTRYLLYFGAGNISYSSYPQLRALLPHYTDDSGFTYLQEYNNNFYFPRFHNQEMTIGHKTSYISIMPYNPQGAMDNVNLTSVKVAVDNQAINGIHKFNVTGIDLSDRPSHNLAFYKYITLKIDEGLSIGKTREDARKKVAVITALPGEYTGVKISYEFRDFGTGVTLSKEKAYGGLKMRLGVGQNLPVYYKLDIPSFNTMINTYHMWGAVSTYWPVGKMPKDWTFANGVGSIAAPAAPNDTWPKDNTDDGQRWYDDQDFTVSSTSMDGDAPTSNDVSYALDKCYWDDKTIYVYDGHLFKGLIWVPIIEKGKSLASDGTDWTSDAPTTNSWNYVAKQPHDVAGYFALPALGYYEDGALKGVGQEGRYWLYDGAAAGDTDHAYSVQFNKNGIKIVYDTPRKHGYMVMPTKSINEH